MLHLSRDAPPDCRAPGMAHTQEKQVIVEGSLYRESNVVSDIVNWRYGALYGPQGPFVTFRQAPAGGAGAGGDTAPQPTKVRSVHTNTR